MAAPVSTSHHKEPPSTPLRRIPSLLSVSNKLKRKQSSETVKSQSSSESPLLNARASFESAISEQSSSSPIVNFWSRKLSTVLTTIPEDSSSKTSRKDSGYGSGDFTSAAPFTSADCSPSRFSQHPISTLSPAGLQQSTKSRPRHVAIVIPSYSEPVPEPLTSSNSIISDFPDFPTPPSSPPIPKPLLRQQASPASGTGAFPGQEVTDMTANGEDSSKPVLHLRDPSTSAFPSYSSSRPSLSRGGSLSQLDHDVPVLAVPVAGIANRTGTSPGAADLPCTVFHTTGDEPPAILGASTTILGDKLYVFGGRLSSQKKQDFLSHMYELDLISRHWTELDTRGDVPSPRFYHSVSTLGDSKLVCYGGLGPAPSSMEPSSWSTYERGITVMSDVSIFDVNTRTWTAIPTANDLVGRYAHCAAVIPSTSFFAKPAGTDDVDGRGGAELVIVGGQGNSSEYLNEICVLNLRSRKWTSITPLNGTYGAYKSIAITLPGMSATQVGEQRSGSRPPSLSTSDELASQSPLLLYSNYNFVDVRVDLKVGSPVTGFADLPMNGAQLPPGLRFPTCGLLAGHLILSGTVITSEVQDYQVWAMNLKTLEWSRVDAAGLDTGSWNKGLLWRNRNAFIVLGNRTGSQANDYQQRRINFSHICTIELDAYGLYEAQGQIRSSSLTIQVSSQASSNRASIDGSLLTSAENLGRSALGLREIADMEILTLGGDRVPVNSAILAKRWGAFFTQLVEESHDAAISSTVVGLSRTTSDAFPTKPNYSTRLPANTMTQSRTPTIHNRNSQSSDMSRLIDSAIGSISDGMSSKHASLITTTSAGSGSTTLLKSRVLFLPHTNSTTRALLFYLYTCSLPPITSTLCTGQVLMSLLQISRTYSISGLLPATISRLHQILSADIVGDVFSAAALAAGDGSSLAGFKPKTDTINPRLQALASLTARQTASPQSQKQQPKTTSGRRRVKPKPSFESAKSHNSTLSNASEISVISDASDANLDSATITSTLLTRERNEVMGLQKRALRGLWEGQALKREALAREREKVVRLSGGSMVGEGLGFRLE